MPRLTPQEQREINRKVDMLGFEFEMSLFPNVLNEARGNSIDIAPKYIPAEVFDKRAVEKSQIVFHDVSFIRQKSQDTSEMKKTWTGGYIFENEWRNCRAKKGRSLELQSVSYEYSAETYKIAIKVVDISVTTL